MAAIRKFHPPLALCNDDAAMRRGSFRCWSGVAVALVLGACSNIIGISNYEIDPALDESAGATSIGSGGKLGSAGKPAVLEGGAPAGGDGAGIGGDLMAGGMASGGTENGGMASAGTENGGSGSAGAPLGGDGAGGDPTIPTGCVSSKDCDDTIDCTTDTCLANGQCGHAPKDDLCDSTRCETCTVGIGCVAGPLKEEQVLVDPNFDAPDGDWDGSDSDITNVVVNAAAQSPTRIAKFGPAASNATKYQYGDLLQYVTLPKGVVGLTVTGYYKLTPTKILHPDDPDDYVTLGFYDLNGGTLPVVQFHTFEGSGAAQTAWKQFTYTAPKDEVAKVLDGGDFSFDIVARAYSAFQFDTMTLTTTTCQ
jgi:hypothetical protein